MGSKELAYGEHCAIAYSSSNKSVMGQPRPQLRNGHGRGHRTSVRKIGERHRAAATGGGGPQAQTGNHPQKGRAAVRKPKRKKGKKKTKKGSGPSFCKGGGLRSRGE